MKEGSPSASGRDVGAFFNYNTDPGEKVLVKVGISYVSTDNALANIEAEVPGWDFEQVKEQARNTWNERLSRIEVSGGSEEDKVKFSRVFIAHCSVRIRSRMLTANTSGLTMRSTEPKVIRSITHFPSGIRFAMHTRCTQ